MKSGMMCVGRKQFVSKCQWAACLAPRSMVMGIVVWMLMGVCCSFGLCLNELNGMSSTYRQPYPANIEES